MQTRFTSKGRRYDDKVKSIKFSVYESSKNSTPFSEPSVVSPSVVEEGNKNVSPNTVTQKYVIRHALIYYKK